MTLLGVHIKANHGSIALREQFPSQPLLMGPKSASDNLDSTLVH